MYRLTLIVAALALVAASLAALGFAVDEYRLWQVRQDVTGWDRAAAIENDRLLATHVDTVEAILARYGPRPDVLFLAAKLHEWRAFLQRANPRHRREQLKIAEDYLSAAVAGRPWWGRAHGALLANAALQDQAWNDDLETRLESAMVLGRYDLQTQLYLVNFAFTRWRSLPPDVQVRMQAFLREVLAFHGEELSDYVRTSFSRAPFDVLYQSVKP